jgi:hypothetical protein
VCLAFEWLGFVYVLNPVPSGNARMIGVVSNALYSQREGQSRCPFQPWKGGRCCSVSFFMNKFRRLGFIEYNGGLHVHSSLLNVILHD